MAKSRFDVLSHMFLVFALVCGFGCGDTPNGRVSFIENEILQLESIAEKKRFLEKVLEDDQKVRSAKGADLLLLFGRDSKEYAEYIETMKKQDEINLFKIEKYLNEYGYPKKNEMGLAANAPWLVIHHSGNQDARTRNLKVIYQAYLEKDIDSAALTFYLGRMYERKFGKRLEMESPYTVEDEIQQFLRDLKFFIDEMGNLERIED